MAPGERRATEAPGVAQVARQYDGQVTIVGIAARDDLALMEEFVARHDLATSTLQAADLDARVWEANGIFGQPAWIFVDGETGAAEKVLGALGEEALTERVAALVG